MQKQKLIKLKLTELGYNKIGYASNKKMDWLDEKNNIVFITIPELIDFKIFIQSTYEFLIPSISKYEDYLKIEKKYKGLPIALEKYDTKYIKWLESIKFYDFIKQNNIEFNINQNYWYIYHFNYNSVEKLNPNPIKKSIKIKKIKI